METIDWFIVGVKGFLIGIIAGTLGLNFDSGIDFWVFMIVMNALVNIDMFKG